MNPLSQSVIEALPKKPGRKRIRTEKESFYRRKEFIGLPCPHCSSVNLRVLDRRGEKRRRECMNCGKRFTSIEIILDDSFFEPGEETGKALKKFLLREGKKALAEFLRDVMEIK